LTRRRAMVTSKRHSKRFYTQQRQQQPVINGKYHYDVRMMVYIYMIYIIYMCVCGCVCVHKYYIRVHHDWQVSSAKRIRLISKPPVPILLVFTPVTDLIASHGTRSRTLADDTLLLLLLLLLLRNWLEKVFWKPVKLSVYCMYVRTALFAKENNIVVRLWVLRPLCIAWCKRVLRL